MTPAGGWVRVEVPQSDAPVPQLYLAIPPPVDSVAHALGVLLGIDDLELHYDAFNRPRIAAAPGVAVPDISISRRPDAMAVAVYAEGRVGVDVDFASRIPSPELLADSLTPDELASFHPDDSASAFFRLWAAKEAMLKAIGQGLVFGLKQIELEHSRVGGLRVAKIRGSAALAKGWNVWTLEVSTGVVPAVVGLAWAS